MSKTRSGQRAAARAGGPGSCRSPTSQPGRRSPSRTPQLATMSRPPRAREADSCQTQGSAVRCRRARSRGPDRHRSLRLDGLGIDRCIARRCGDDVRRAGDRRTEDSRRRRCRRRHRACRLRRDLMPRHADDLDERRHGGLLLCTGLRWGTGFLRARKPRSLRVGKSLLLRPGIRLRLGPCVLQRLGAAGSFSLRHRVRRAPDVRLGSRVPKPSAVHVADVRRRLVRVLRRAHDRAGCRARLHVGSRDEPGKTLRRWRSTENHRHREPQRKWASASAHGIGIGNGIGDGIGNGIGIGIGIGKRHRHRERHRRRHRERHRHLHRHRHPPPPSTNGLGATA